MGVLRLDNSFKLGGVPAARGPLLAPAALGKQTQSIKRMEPEQWLSLEPGSRQPKFVVGAAGLQGLVLAVLSAQPAQQID
jgi:hypothetical protein